MFTRSEFVAAGQPAPRFSISQIRPFPQCAPSTTVEIYHLRNHGYSNYKRVVREIRTLRAMWRALENGTTAIPKRARRGKPRIQAKEEPTGHRASARPYQVPDEAAAREESQHHEFSPAASSLQGTLK